MVLGIFRHCCHGTRNIPPLLSGGLFVGDITLSWPHKSITGLNKLGLKWPKFQNVWYLLHLWAPAYTPGDGQTSWVYSSNPVLHLYRSCYLTVNKPVLSYLLLCLLPHTSQFWPSKFIYLKYMLNWWSSNKLRAKLMYWQILLPKVAGVNSLNLEIVN